MKLLKEILNSKIEYEVITHSGDEFRTAANIGDRSIIFTALFISDDEGWEIGFKEVKKSGTSSHQVTNSGKEYDVFSMVKDSLLDFIRRYDPEEFYFSAEKDDEDPPSNVRADLYDHLVRRLQSKVSDYKYTRTRSDYRDYFVLKKAT